MNILNLILLNAQGEHLASLIGKLIGFFIAMVFLFIHWDSKKKNKKDKN